MLWHWVFAPILHLRFGSKAMHSLTRVFYIMYNFQINIKKKKFSLKYIKTQLTRRRLLSDIYLFFSYIFVCAILFLSFLHHDRKIFIYTFLEMKLHFASSYSLTLYNSTVSQQKKKIERREQETKKKNVIMECDEK